MTIKVLEKTEGCMPQIIDKGDWIDLYTAEDIVLRAPYAKTLHIVKKDGNNTEKLRDVIFDSALVNLGVAMKLPKGFEAIIAPRSSTFKKYGIIQSDMIAVIDSSYCGNNDIWKLPITATRNITIPKGTRLCQFRVQLSQKATVWQKIKWLFSNGTKLKKVDSLDDTDRGGFGTSGTN